MIGERLAARGHSPRRASLVIVIMAKKRVDQSTRIDRVHEFDAKSDFLVEKAGLREVSIPEYFRLLFDRFGATYLQEFKHLPAKAIVPDGWCCALVKRFVKENESTGEAWRREYPRSFVVTREYERTLELQGCRNCYTSPLVYIGNKRPGKNARAFFAFVFDIDRVTMRGLEFFYNAIRNGRAPRPSMVVSSGSGVHLYYLLMDPLALNSYSGPMLHYLKLALTAKLWGMCSDSNDVQYHGIFQGYRVPGTRPKDNYGLGQYVKGYVDATGDIPYYTCADLNQYLGGTRTAALDPPLSYRQVSLLDSMIYDPTRQKTPIGIAKENWPWWYVRKNNKIDIASAVHKIKESTGAEPARTIRWKVNVALYDWWLSILRDTVANKVTVGHRYHCIIALAVFASKCQVPYTQLEKDARSLYSFMESLTVDPTNHFRHSDIEDALTVYHSGRAYLYTRYTLSRITGIDMPANKRNHRKQNLHLQIARQTQAILREHSGTDWREGNGAHSKQDLVFWWRQANPLHDDDGQLLPGNSDKSRCARECTYIGHSTLPAENGKKRRARVEKHLSRMTVDKWWYALPVQMDGVGYIEYVTWLNNDDRLTPHKKAELWENRPKGFATNSGLHAQANAICEVVEKEIDRRIRSGQTLRVSEGEWRPGRIARMAKIGMTKDEIIRDFFGQEV